MLFDRDARRHQGQRGGADRSLGGGAVALKGFRYAADRIRKLALRRKHRQKRRLSQCAVTDLAASGTSGDTGLTDGIGREIVLVQIALVGRIDIQAVHLLHVGKRCQGADIADLRLSSGKHAGAVDARDGIDLRRQRTDLRHLSAVRAFAVL